MISRHVIRRAVVRRYTQQRFTLFTSSVQSRVPRLTLYTGTDCQLCDVAKGEIEMIAKQVPPFELRLFNIRDDTLDDVQRWRRAYQYDIPVLHIDGQEVARHRIRKDELIEKIRTAAQ